MGSNSKNCTSVFELMIEWTPNRKRPMANGLNMWTNLRLIGTTLPGIFLLTWFSQPGPQSRCGSAFSSTACAAQAELKSLAKPTRKPGLPTDQATLRIPPVLLTTDHRKRCRVHIGDSLPPIELPLLGGNPTKLATLQGKQATVILFWHPHHWMTQDALNDISGLTKQWANQRVKLVGIASGQPAGKVQTQLTAVGAEFPQLLDTDNHAYSQVSNLKASESSLPWIIVLDAEGKIAWFDIEYSESSRRELRQTVSVLVKKP
jgi:peroxiredoxin